MGKITVETCHIEGLKVLHHRYLEMNAAILWKHINYNDFKEAGIDVEFVRITNPAQQRVY